MQEHLYMYIIKQSKYLTIMQMTQSLSTYCVSIWFCRTEMVNSSIKLLRLADRLGSNFLTQAAGTKPCLSFTSTFHQSWKYLGSLMLTQFFYPYIITQLIHIFVYSSCFANEIFTTILMIKIKYTDESCKTHNSLIYRRNRRIYVFTLLVLLSRVRTSPFFMETSLGDFSLQSYRAMTFSVPRSSTTGASCCCNSQPNNH